MQTAFQTISPIDDSVYVERTFADATEIERVLAKAEAAQKSWRKTSVDARAAICRKAVEWFLDHTDAIAKELTWQMGRPIRYTPFEISGGFKERALHMIDLASTQLSDLVVEKSSNFQRFIRREPIGTVLVLAPWNYPYLTSVNLIIPALMSGNTVLLKHAQQTPLCAERYAKAFREAGLPEGVFQYLHLTHAQVAEVIADTRIAHIAFTGSVTGGEAVQKAIGSRFIHSGLELGGKDPAYVRVDAPLEYTIEQLVDGAFFNSGQSCCGIERIYVHEAVFQDFLDGFIGLTKKYKLGNPLDRETTLGPMVSNFGC